MSGPRVAAIQMTTGADVADNLEQAGTLIAEAADRGALVAALPENFAFMGHRDVDKRAVAEPEGAGPIQEFLSGSARRHRLMVIGGTMPIAIPGGDGRVAAASLVFDADGQRVGRYDKIHLFDVDLPSAAETYRESAHVAPGGRVQLLDTPAGRLGMAVCYDIRFPELFRRLSAQGADWFVLPSAFTVPTGEAHWETLLRARAIENLAFVVAPAQSGRHANGRLTYGDTMIVDYWGRVLARRPSGPGCVVAEFDCAAQADARLHFPALRHRTL
ncbi:MAG: carbon-nitrogen hydrolase family protein [Steroidobacteraceae bacterium]